MEGVTDIVFRHVILRAGEIAKAAGMTRTRPDILFTEFTNVSSYVSEKGRNNALERLDTTPDEKPIIAQIWGKNPEHFAETAKSLESLGFDGLDINMGCPDRHVNKAGGGAAMIKTPDLAIKCIAKARENTNLPISIKTRLGFTYLDEYETWLPLLLAQNLDTLTVHLRTRKEMSKVLAHYELIPEILKLRDNISPMTKITINGDIENLAHAKTIHKQYPEINGFMIGRGVFANPFCFTEYVPTKEDLFELFMYHLDLYDARAKELAEKGSRYPYEPLKHFFKLYINNFPGASDFRQELMSCKNTDELRNMCYNRAYGSKA